MTQSKVINSNLGILLVRIYLGLVFIGHGWMKLSDMPGTIKFFAFLGLPLFMAYFISLLEFIFGICMLAGVFTRWAGLLLACDMFFAIVLVAHKKHFLGGWELELGFLLASLAVAFLGSGDYSLAKYNKYL